MSKKGTTTTCSFLEWEKAIYLVSKLEKEENYKISLLIAIGIYTGMRISDILSLKWSDILDKQSLTIKEQKTAKMRVITFNTDLQQIAKDAYCNMNINNVEQLVFINYRKEKAISIQYLNKQLKKAVSSANYDIGNVSSHFLRKTFGRRVWDKNNRSDESLIKLSEVFNHSNIAITKRYLGIRQEEIADVYLSL